MGEVDSIYQFFHTSLNANTLHVPEDGSHFALGYYLFLFEDPAGIRVASVGNLGIMCPVKAILVSRGDWANRAWGQPINTGKRA